MTVLRIGFFRMKPWSWVHNRCCWTARASIHTYTFYVCAHRYTYKCAYAHTHAQAHTHTYMCWL